MEVIQYNHRIEVTDASSDEINLLKKHLSVPFYSYRNGKMVRDRVEKLYYEIDGNLNFTPGMLDYLADQLDPKGFDIEVDDVRIPPIPHVRFKNYKQKHDPWKNQKEALDAVMKDDEGFGFISCIMGSGKSRIIDDIVHLRKVYTLIIAPTTSIRDAHFRRLEGYYGKGVVSNKIPNSLKEKSRIEMSTSYSKKSDRKEYEYLKDKGFEKVRGQWMKTSKAKNDIYGRKSKKERQVSKMPPILILCPGSISNLPQEYLEMVEMLIVDEGHIGSISSIRNMIEQMSSCFYRYFISATMWRDQKEDHLMLMSASGSRVIYEEIPVETIEDKRAAMPEYHSLRAPLPEEPVGYWGKDKKGNSKIVYAKDFDIIVKKGLVGNVTRNDLIIKTAKKEYNEGRRVLICVTEQAHADLLGFILEDSEYKYIQVYGTQEKHLKEENIEIASNGRDPIIVIGTFAIGIGVDTKNIDSVILADVRKASIRVLQSEGRGSRVKDYSFTFRIFDIYDWFHPKLEEHSKKRYGLFMSYFKSTRSMTVKMWERFGINLKMP